MARSRGLGDVYKRQIQKWSNRIIVALMVVTFFYLAAGLGMRWIISGHAPWSNGYEAVVFIAWVTMIAGFSFTRKNIVILAGTAILASLMIFVTELSLFDPEITPLVPVLKSYWLKIHVAIITGSYGFLGLAAILGLLNLVLYTVRNEKNKAIVTININELTYVSEMTMTIGLFMLTIGTFLGGIWANESWGRYWGWDPKETWALVSVLVYAVILHLRFIPKLNGKFLFNVMSFWGYSAILFTFFGVNFMLVGLHSYANGDGIGKFPTWLSLTILFFAGFTAFASFRNKSLERKSKKDLLSE
jgi:cytochrome c-type biogenesis protein CcsB